MFSCNFLAKQKISKRKLTPFLEFLEQRGLNDIQYFRHRSEYSVREVFLTIGMTIKEMILENVREAGIYGFLADDATDVAVVEQIVAFVSYINPPTSRQEVKFLFIEDVLNDPEADGASADVLLNACVHQCNACVHQWPCCYPKEESQIIDRVVKRWSQVPRRKLPKVQCSTPMHVTSVTTGSNG